MPVLKRMMYCVQIVVLASCTSVNLFMDGAEVVVASSAGEVRASASQIELPEEIRMGVYGMYAGEDGLLLAHLERSWHFTWIPEDGSEAVPLIHSGRGPGELRDARIVSLWESGGRQLLSASDINAARMLTVDVGTSMADHITAVVADRDIPRNCIKVFDLGGGRLLCKQLRGEDGICYRLVDADGAEQAKYPIYGKGDYASDYTFFASEDCLKPDGTKLAVCMRSLDKIHILDLAGGDHHTIVTERKYKRQNDMKEFETVDRMNPREWLLAHYYWCACTDEYIYALHAPGDEIRVFDWAGSQFRTLKLDMPLNFLSVSPDGSALYGVTQDEDLVKIALN